MKIILNQYFEDTCLMVGIIYLLGVFYNSQYYFNKGIIYVLFVSTAGIALTLAKLLSFFNNKLIKLLILLFCIIGVIDELYIIIINLYLSGGSDIVAVVIHTIVTLLLILLIFDLKRKITP